jgi:hypothetical protein
LRNIQHKHNTFYNLGRRERRERRERRKRRKRKERKEKGGRGGKKKRKRKTYSFSLHLLCNSAQANFWPRFQSARVGFVSFDPLPSVLAPSPACILPSIT